MSPILPWRRPRGEGGEGGDLVPDGGVRGGHPVAAPAASDTASTGGGRHCLGLSHFLAFNLAFHTTYTLSAAPVEPSVEGRIFAKEQQRSTSGLCLLFPSVRPP